MMTSVANLVAGADVAYRSGLDEQLSLVEVGRGNLREYYLQVVPLRRAGRQESLHDLYERVADFLVESEAELVTERCYGVSERCEEIRTVRSRVYAESGVESAGTLSFVGGQPCSGGAVAGLQIWAVRSESGFGVQTMRFQGQDVGRRFSHRGIDYASLAGVAAPSAEPGSATRQEEAASMFRQANRILNSHGFRYGDVLRTWIYLPELLNWYSEFNAARWAVYREVGIVDGTQILWLPASTGIQGKCADGRHVFMDVMAVRSEKPGAVSCRMLNSPLQCEAWQYGSAFCRAVELQDESSSRVYVSGTASIDRAGRTVFQGDSEGQMRHTLRVLRELLSPRGHDFSHVAHAVVFLKDVRDAELFRHVADGFGLDPRVVIYTEADVCRNDLLCEVELTTVNPRGPHRNN